ncbi:putative NAD(P)-binding domain, NAD(P)-binding domain superfamily [Helianthus annuus]|nr:putative NAD(P)-binding domain, NAD(P)-binding domain superfamily [Helianthus annuus]
MATVLPSSISSYKLLHSSHDNLLTNSTSCISLTNARKRPVLCFSSKKRKPGFFDVILDYIEGGPKLRKWYGAPDLYADDGSNLEEADKSSEEDEVRDAVLVTDGDNEIGQTIILSLIIKRIRVKALVKDKRAAMESFGTYVESISGDPKDSSFLKKSLKGVRAVICPNEGFLSKAESLTGVQHVVILSQLSVYRASSGVQAMMSSNARNLAEQDESTVIASGIPYTIVRTGVLTNDRGGKPGFSFEKGCTTNGSLSKEDAAFICIEALDVVPEKELVFEVVNGEENVLNWKDQFEKLKEQE